MKKCSICKEQKELNEFSFLNKKLNKRMSACKACISIINKEKRIKFGEKMREKSRILYQENKENISKYQREYRIKHPEEIMATVLKSKFGITKSDYDKVLNLQDNKCAICGKDINENGKIFSPHYNSTTGEVRGLLCDHCKHGLTFYEKHKDKYIEYLKNTNR